MLRLQQWKMADSGDYATRQKVRTNLIVVHNERKSICFKRRDKPSGRIRATENGDLQLGWLYATVMDRYKCLNCCCFVVVVVVVIVIIIVIVIFGCGVIVFDDGDHDIFGDGIR